MRKGATRVWLGFFWVRFGLLNPPNPQRRKAMSLGSRQYVDQNGIVYLEAGAGDVVGTSSPLVGATLPAQVRGSGLTLVGVITMLLGIWGGIISFMGPTFAYSADGSSAWNMNNAHLVLAVLPGAAAFATGLAILMVAPRIVAGAGRERAVPGRTAGPLGWSMVCRWTGRVAGLVGLNALLRPSITAARAGLSGRLCPRTGSAGRHIRWVHSWLGGSPSGCRREVGGDTRAQR